MRVLSLGAGVQSSTLLLMAVHGELELDAAIFADTGWEPAAVYKHLDWLEQETFKAEIPLYRVSAGDIRTNALAGGYADMPLYMESPDGSRHMGRRQCTNQYKLRPIRAKLRELSHHKPVDLLVGISLDEWQRAKDADVKWITHRFPLIDQRMTRANCVTWLERHGYAEPPKSSCIGCPFQTPRQWRRLTPDEMHDAVAFDEAIRDLSPRGKQYLYRDFVPLAMADLRSQQDRGQLDLFDGCGVLCAADVA